MKVPEPDVRSLLDAIYSFDVKDASEWCERVGAAAERSVPGALRAHCALLRWRGTDPPDFIALGPQRDMSEPVRRSISEPTFARAVMAMGTVNLAAPVLARGHVGPLPHFVAAGVLPLMPRDIFLLQAQSDDSSGATLALYFEHEQEQLTPSLRERWTEIASHLAAAARLRLSGLPRPEVVLDDKQRVVDARIKSAREALRQAARAIDRVRGRRVQDAQEALALWRALTDGRWTIADDFDAQGRRTIVAYEDVPLPTLAMPKLSLRERQVVCFVALGHTNKQIGYELGVSPSSVATHLSKAMKKLGVSSRAALVTKLIHGP